MILSKVTKNQGFKLSLKNAISEKPKGCIGFGVEIKLTQVFLGFKEQRITLPKKIVQNCLFSYLILQ